MGVSEFFHNLWDLVRRPFEDCTSCCDVLDRDYYRKTSPGVRRTPQMFNRWDYDVKFDVGSHPPSRLPSSLPPVPNSYEGRTQRSFTSPCSGSGSSSASRSMSPSSYSYDEEENDDERQMQFLFYGGSDPPTPTGGAYPSGYRSDMISKYVEPMSPASIASPRINHEMPCFFSPRTTPTSPMSAPIYSPHLFKINEQRTRIAEYYRRYTSR
ncbi:hypothetical protein PF005_g22967 [Phytophthora fragariae]|uniref:Uncharacterized protein n=1 Tax=Phytophthora fragariae TaxID=53985 RepID=A0A6A3DY14_9STRA|nr:hypothetical protein PF003_g38788 [Phytophthora fragariae]KAE8925066.1 hypothetical protein PF009_g24721 [Phytophthora fragariae]KAE9002577.1 hypothetical protein PF011_g13253 [Phytophthora fragariae]KAE9078580.1 hypothetical protein PF010_g23086 [Phytophthora fragariae]KAE9079505.1 hypothetical protein PF007_g23420 [Phytophthora fragariae]